MCIRDRHHILPFCIFHVKCVVFVDLMHRPVSVSLMTTLYTITVAYCQPWYCHVKWHTLVRYHHSNYMISIKLFIFFDLYKFTYSSLYSLHAICIVAIYSLHNSKTCCRLHCANSCYWNSLIFVTHIVTRPKSVLLNLQTVICIKYTVKVSITLKQ